MVKKKKEAQEATVYNQPIILEEKGQENELSARLEEIRNYEGVMGYILRNSTSASIDFDDSAKIADYAIFSSSSAEAGKELSEIFQIGQVANVMIEGKNAKMLSLLINTNRISIFMKNDADTEKILKRLCSP